MASGPREGARAKLRRFLLENVGCIRVQQTPARFWEHQRMGYDSRA